MADEKGTGFKPEPSDPEKRMPRVAPGAAGEDPANNPEYDNSEAQQGLDNEILKRRRIGRWMSIAAVVSMAAFTLAFFTYAIFYAHRFIKLYIAHVHQLIPADGLSETSAVFPLVIPMLPATFFSVLGLATMVTCVRFITAYVNATGSDSSDATLIERLARELAGILRALKTGSGPD